MQYAALIKRCAVVAPLWCKTVHHFRILMVALWWCDCRCSIYWHIYHRRIYTTHTAMHMQHDLPCYMIPVLACVLGMTLNCIHIFIVTGSFLYWCVMRPASQRFFILSCIYLRILIISYLATFLGTNRFSVLMCRKAVNQSINLCLRLFIIFVSVFRLCHVC